MSFNLLINLCHQNADKSGKSRQKGIVVDHDAGACLSNSSNSSSWAANSIAIAIAITIAIVN
jgi:hypothetical protein